MAHRSTGNTQMLRPCLVTLRDGLWKSAGGPSPDANVVWRKLRIRGLVKFCRLTAILVLLRAPLLSFLFLHFFLPFFLPLNCVR